MSYTIVWLETAIDGLRQLRAAKPDDVKTLTAAVGSLAIDPRPDAAHQLGTSDLYRLRAADLRVVYEVDDEQGTIYVLTIGRLLRL